MYRFDFCLLNSQYIIDDWDKTVYICLDNLSNINIDKVSDYFMNRPLNEDWRLIKDCKYV